MNSNVGTIRLGLNEISRLAELLAGLTEHNVTYTAELRGDYWVIETFH